MSKVSCFVGDDEHEAVADREALMERMLVCIMVRILQDHCGFQLLTSDPAWHFWRTVLKNEGKRFKNE
jgi:hypothetical protein